MYRVYDNKEKKWIKDEIFLSPNNDLYEIKRNKFYHKAGRIKLIPDQRYTYHMDIGLYDVNNQLIFEGDIAQFDDGMIGLISYSPENASYVFLDYNEMKYYPLGIKICKNNLKVIGNLFDNPELLTNKFVQEAD